MHMPRWDDDILLKPNLRDHFTRDNVVSTFGLFLMLCGLLFVFVVLPIISYTGASFLDYPYDTPLSQMPGYYGSNKPWNWVNNKQYPLLNNVRTGLIDPDTPKSAMTRVSVNGDTFVAMLVADDRKELDRDVYEGRVRAMAV